MKEVFKGIATMNSGLVFMGENFRNIAITTLLLAEIKSLQMFAGYFLLIMQIKLGTLK